MSEAQTEVTLWASREDNGAVLCNDCGLKELNNTFAVLLGVLPPFPSVEAANEWYVENYGEGTTLDDEEVRPFSADDPAFVKTTEGTCLTCGATNDASDVA